MIVLLGVESTDIVRCLLNDKSDSQLCRKRILSGSRVGIFTTLVRAHLS